MESIFRLPKMVHAVTVPSVEIGKLATVALRPAIVARHDHTVAAAVSHETAILDLRPPTAPVV